ncbi:MAG: type II secretory pathway pseudopilin PulG [Gammaproteobacteria bacterium]|jgi:type II secretory pathway pseudopilin PulG
MRHASGFTLVEALVAVTLLALLFGALMPVFHNGLAVLQSGERHTRAVMLARSVLERQRVAAVLPASASANAGDIQGRFDDFRWQVTRAPFIDGTTREANQTTLQTTPIAKDAATASFMLQQISVVVHWPGNEYGVQLHSLVLVGQP